MTIFNTLAPVLLLILLGILLARVRFLGLAFMADLNKLAFWIALPALLLRSIMHAQWPGSQTFHMIGALLTATAISALAGWAASFLLHLPQSSYGTLIQSAFRGNLAYIGIPVLAYAFAGQSNGKGAFTTAVIVMAFLMIFYNVLAVIVLQASRDKITSSTLGVALKSIVTNPIILAGMAGLIVSFTQAPIPLFLDRALEALGGAAVPIALLCIGGSLAHAQLSGRLSSIVIAALIKTALAPLAIWVFASAFHLDPAELRITLIFATCPTAVAAYVMARQMGGDESLASGSIVLSTIFSGVSLPILLWLTGS